MNIGIFYFSATGVTEAISNHIATILEKEGNSVTKMNIISPDSRQSLVDFSEYDACFFGFPVFGGRPPTVAEEWMMTLDGKNQKCSMFFTYGARDLEWAHQITYFLLTQAKFRVVLSAEFIGKHSFNVAEGFSLAEGRPNQLDINIATEFALQSIERIQKENVFTINLSEFSYHPKKVEENTGPLAIFYPSREENECSMCYLCEKECPVSAFDANSGKTNRKLCITCMHCVTICPDKLIHVGEASQLFKHFTNRLGLTEDIVEKKKSRIFFEILDKTSNKSNSFKMIELNSGKINDYLHLVDVNQFQQKRALSVYIAEFDESTVIFDCGTSLDIKNLLRYMRRNNIELSSVKYIVVSHYHFDHVGGLWKLYDDIKKQNPDVKIISSPLTMNKSNNFENERSYLMSKKAFSVLVGEIKQIEASAFRIINPDEWHGKNLESLNIIDTFKLKSEVFKLAALKIPGHSPDQISTVLIKDNKIDFIHLGEALGILTYPEKGLTIPSSSAPDFNYESYMRSIEMLKTVFPLNAGFCHFGLVSGVDNICKLINDHESIVRELRQNIIKLYRENPETRYIAEKLYPILSLRVNTDGINTIINNPAILKIIISLIYGMLMDLGFRS